MAGLGRATVPLAVHHFLPVTGPLVLEAPPRHIEPARAFGTEPTD